MSAFTSSERRQVGAVLAVSLAAILFLFWLIYGYAPESRWAESFGFLPAFNATCNAFSTLFIISGIYLIRSGNKRGHGIAMTCALASSGLFLLGYILHHSLHGDTRFIAEGWIRPLYFAILISHVILSVVALPMVLMTVFWALTGKWARHRALARWTYPIWLYVSVTGVLIFFFLRFFNH
ncbi:MAG: DUF420 domain-containing protein [Opitutales bacterium]|nr:DUF420 domain-containing protein [Opitutales bacterium]